MKDEWCVVPAFPDYEASRSGAVRRIATGRVLRPRLTEKGYHRVTIRRDRKSFYRRVHVLVASAFLGPKPAGMDVNHDDGDKLNNAITNLEYLTRGENHKHAYRTGLKVAPRGERHSKAKLSDADVRSIRKMLASHTKASVARKFGVAFNTIRDIETGRTWRHCA